jgi:Zn-dependent peptidase ImmA (M78 family)
MKIKLYPVVYYLYPELDAFCCTYDYTLPPLDYFKQNIKFNITAKIKTSEVNSIPLGNYSGNTGLINLAHKNRTTIQILKTLLHELGHVIQHYNVGVYWNQVYAHQATINSYQDNTFEKQARYASCLLDNLSSVSLEVLEIKLKGILETTLKTRQIKLLFNKQRSDTWSLSAHKQDRSEILIRKNRKAIEKLHTNKFSNTKL